MNKFIHRTLIAFIFSVLVSNLASAEKVECDLLSPMQKKIYQAYCKSIAKKEAAANNSSNNNNIDKTKSLLKKGMGKLNTDSKLTDWVKERMKK